MKLLSHLWGRLTPDPTGATDGTNERHVAATVGTSTAVFLALFCGCFGPLAKASASTLIGFQTTLNRFWKFFGFRHLNIPHLRI
jgi:hypothetical protein